VNRPRSLALLAIVFTTVYALAYVIAVWKNYPLFTYHPLAGTFALGVEKPQDGPAMYWFGWMATAGLTAAAACIVAWLLPERFARRVASGWAWAIPLGVLIFFAYLLRGYFLRG
jgi:hypothetical protein